MIRILSAAVTVAVCIVLAAASATTAWADPITVNVQPVPLHEDDATINKVGKLIYRGGLHLQSRSDRFGGFSALGLSADGKRMISLTDEGNRLDARLVYGDDGTLTGLENTEIFTLMGPEGRPLIEKPLADAESMAPGVSGEIIVGFEQAHRVWAYHPGEAGPRPLPLPDEMSGATRNRGIEALALLDDGRLFALSEGLGRDDAILGWVSDERGWNVLLYKGRDGYRPTGAATLPNGDVVLLERHFTPRQGVRIRLRRIAGQDIEAGASIGGELLAEIRAPYTVDNFEGVEAIRGPNGETRLFLISDDNFNRRSPQRTLFMMFELSD